MEAKSVTRPGDGEEVKITAARDPAGYDDAIVKLFFIATVIWGVVGMLVGVFIALAARLVAGQPRPRPDSRFGRLRPLHTNAVIFAFCGNICFTGIYYSMQRLLKTRMWSD